MSSTSKLRSESHREMPPIPEKVVTAHGRVAFTREEFRPGAGLAVDRRPDRSRRLARLRARLAVVDRNARSA